MGSERTYHEFDDENLRKTKTKFSVLHKKKSTKHKKIKNIQQNKFYEKL